MNMCRDLQVAVLISALVAGVTFLHAGESFSLGDREDWTGNGLLTNDDGTLGLKGGSGFPARRPSR